MKIYLAGTSVTNPKAEKILPNLFRRGHKLHSYFHCVNGFEKKWFKMNKKNKVDLFLDSGAFSAWTQGVNIDIQKYIEFIKKNEKVITVYANLDVIGNAKQTYKNQKIMEKAGLTPLPVFHHGENYKWLKMYLEEGYSYISLGGMVPINTKNLILWLDTLFSKYLTNENGIPKVKIHAFGLTSHLLMFRYPWYSVDSTSWVVTGRLGSLFIPVYRQSKWRYDLPPHKIAVSSISPTLKEAGKHISNLSVKQQEILLLYLTEMGYKLGKSSFKMCQQTYELKENERWSGKKPVKKHEERKVEILKERGVCNVYQLRDELNVLYYLNLEKTIPKYPWAFKIKQLQKRLF